MHSWETTDLTGFDGSGLSTDINSHSRSNLYQEERGYPSVNINDKPNPATQVELGLGLADPRLQLAGQYLGFGSLGSSRTESFNDLLLARHAHPSLSIFPEHTVLPVTQTSRFAQLFQRKMAAEAGQGSANGSSSSNTPSSKFDTTTGNPSLDRSAAWQRTTPITSTNLTVNASAAEELAGYGRDTDSQDDTPRPVTSDGVIYPKASSMSAADRHPASADANLPIPLPAWQTPLTSASAPGQLHSSDSAAAAAAYRPQPQQSAYYQRMLAAKMAAHEETLANKNEEHAYVSPPVNPNDMALMPSTYSPMYQIFSQGGNSLDSHYQAQHSPQVPAQAGSWGMADTGHPGQPFVHAEDHGSYLGLASHHYPEGYPQAHHSGASNSWQNYYATEAAYQQATQRSHASGFEAPTAESWNRSQSRSVAPIPAPTASAAQPPAVEDWMAAWPHIKNPGYALDHKPAAESSKQGRSSGQKGSRNDSEGGKDEPPKKAALACHFCRGRKLKCDAIRPTCSHCAKRSLSCSYDIEIRRRGPGKRKKELIAQQQARASGEPYQDGRKNGNNKKRKSDSGKENDAEADSQSDSAGQGSVAEMTAHTNSAERYVQSYPSHVPSGYHPVGDYHDNNTNTGANPQAYTYASQMYQQPPGDAYYGQHHLTPYHNQYEAVSHDRNRPPSHGYEGTAGGNVYEQGYSADRASEEHRSKRVKTEG